MMRSSDYYLNKENVMAVHSTNSSQRHRVRHSPSLFSLKSMIALKKSDNSDEIQVSQPTLDNSSREKLRNKVRQSPSMMSLSGILRKPELVHDSEKRIIAELLLYTQFGKLESNIVETYKDNNVMHYEHYDLSYTNPQEILNRIYIHQKLQECITEDGSRFIPIESVHLERIEAKKDSGYLCTLGFRKSYLSGTKLDRYEPINSSDSISTIMKLAQLLAVAEQRLRFEHRNLHAGNILVHRSDSNDEVTHVIILNCELGRLDTKSYTPLDHPAFYKARLPVLNEMRRVVIDPSLFCPATNVMWLSYITRYLYNQSPSSDLKKLEGIMNPPKWKMRRKPRSSCDIVLVISKNGVSL